MAGSAPSTTAFWGFTLNNPTDDEMTILEHVAPEYLREIVWTPEIGADGTPHLQGWLKLHRQQRLSFMKKFLGRAHWVPLCSSEYIFNTKHYAQKHDDTAVGATIHRFYASNPTLESLLKRVVEKIIRTDLELVKRFSQPMTRLSNTDLRSWTTMRREAEEEVVESDYRLAKILSSDVYMRMWKMFGRQMAYNIYTQNPELADDSDDSEEEAEVEVPTHTHTHTQLAGSIISHNRHNHAPPSSPSTQGSEEDDEA